MNDGNPSSAFQNIPEPDPGYLIATEHTQDSLDTRTALVIIVSDRAAQAESDGEPAPDDTARLVAELLEESGFSVDGIVTVRSKKSHIRKALETAVVGGSDLALTIGGTGVGPRDRTPAATRPVLDRLVPGIAQAIRISGMGCGCVEAATSCGIAGVSGSTVVVNVASSRAAIRDGMATLLPLVSHVVGQLHEASGD